MTAIPRRDCCRARAKAFTTTWQARWKATVHSRWLGAPNSIKGPTEATFRHQSGNNLLIVGQREEATLAMFCTGLISLAAQYPLGSAQFILCDATPPATPERDYLHRVVQAIPHKI